jgi:hypothetical protein
MSGLVIPWEEVPPCYKWAAKDDDGGVYVYVSKPIIGSAPFGSEWLMSFDDLVDDNKFLFVDESDNNWRESLTERPKQP